MRIWKWFLAYFRLSDLAVCEMSIGRTSWNDYHDYLDTKEKIAIHWEVLVCDRCGKAFII